MTQLNPTQNTTDAVPSTLAGLMIVWTRFCLRLLLTIPVALAKGVIEVSGAIGKAAGMAYTEPFMPNGKYRK